MSEETVAVSKKMIKEVIQRLEKVLRLLKGEDHE